MEGLTQEDNVDEVIVIDDSFDEDIPGNAALPCTGKPSGTGSEPSKAETVPGGSTKSETAPEWYSEPAIPPGVTEKSLAKHVVTTSGQVKTVGFKGRVILVHADLPVSSVEGYSGRDTASEHLHREEVQDANSLENLQPHSANLTAETCQSSIGESNETECASINACSEFSKADSNAEKADTHTDAGKAAKRALTPEKSSESESVTSSLDSKSVEKSSDGTPLKCSMENESTSGDVQNDCLVIPTSSKELNSHQIPSGATGTQLTPPGTSTASYKCGQELPQSPQAPRHFIIRNKNTAAKHEAVRKPGDKLTSLLQRLTSGKSGKVSVQLSTMTNPQSLPDTKAEVNQPSLSVSPSASIQDKPAVSQHAVTEISPTISEKPAVTFSSLSQEPFSMSTPRLPPKTDSSTKADESPSLLKAETSKTVSFTNVAAPASGRDPVIVLPQVRYGIQAKKSHQISTSVVQTKPAEAFMKPGRQLFQVFGAVDDSKQSPKSPATLGFPALIPAGKLKYVLSYLPVQGPTSAASNIVLKGPEGQNVLSVQGSRTSNIVMKGPEGQNVLPVQGSRASNIILKGPEGQNVLSVQGSRTSNIVLKGPEGQNVLPVQGSTALNILLKGPEGQNILLGKAGEAYLPQPSGVHKTTRKSKYQFSLLQNPSSKMSEAVQVSASLQGGAKKPSPTVRSLLASSITIDPVLNSTKAPTSETPSANTSTSLSNIRATIAVQNIKKPSAFSNTGDTKRTRTHKRQYQLATPDQVLIQPLLQPVAVTASGNDLSPAATTVTLSKLAVPPSTCKVRLGKACIVPVSSTTAGRPIFVMSATGSPVPALLIPTSGVNSKSLLAPGKITYNNITATPNQSSETLKTVTKTPEVNPTTQSSASTAHSFSELISRIALQTVPSTSVNKPVSDGNSSMQALNLALLQQLRQQHGVSAAPLRIIVSQGSGVKSTAKLIYAQSPSGVYPCGTVTTQARKTANVSKTAPRPLTVPDVSSKQVPKLIYPKPVSTDEVTGAPAKAKGVSLLTMSLVRKSLMTSECHGKATVADVAAKPYLITKDKNVKSADSQLEGVKPKGSQIVEVRGLKETSTNNTTQKSKKEKVSPRTPATRKRKNAVYTAILRTGQGPVSVRLVAPDMDDDSSDTMSDTGVSHVTLSEESVFTTKDAIGQESDVDSGPSIKLCESDIPDLLCSKHQANSGPETCDGAVLNTELQDMEYSTEPAVSHRHYHHHVQDLSGEETDTDTEVMAMEEQDMSVLRQLLTNTGAKSLCNSETTQKVDKFSATSDLVSSAGNQSGNALSADHEDVAPLLSNSENSSSLDQVVIEEDEDADFCDLKIESVFSLRDPSDSQDIEPAADGQVCQDLPDDETELLPMFNIQTSDDWKSFLNPCFVVLERLSKSELLVGQTAKVAPKCSEHCRKRTLDYLCNLNLLRCVNHPDPFLFQKPKLKRGSVKKTLKKIVRHEVIKEKCIPEDNSNSFQMVKDVYGQKAADESVMVMKTADLARVMSTFFPVVKDVGKSPPAVKETCVKEDLGKSASMVKDISKSPSVMKESFVKRDGKLPLVLKATARKTMNKPAPKVKLTFVKKPFSVVSPLTKEARIKASISELHVKEVGVKETSITSPPLVKELCGEDVNQLSHKVQEACVEHATTKPSPVIKESDVVKSVPDCSFLLANVNPELPHTPPETAFVSDTVHLPATPSGDHLVHIATAQDDQKTNDNKTYDLDSVCSGPKTSKFSRALKQLQKQVNKKRVTMLTEKLSRKKHRGSSKKQNVRRCKIKLAGQKRINKVAVKRLRKKRLSKNVLLSTDMVKILTESRKARLSAAGKQHIHSLPDLDRNISHKNSTESILPQNKELCSTVTPGVKPSSDPRTTHLANVQTKNIKSKGQFVRLQPKMPVIAQEKIQSALQSLNSYLAATGRKPTTGNTQFILLKIDDQHVLVKWPATSLPLTQQSSMPNIKITPVTSAADNTQSKMNSGVNKEKQNEAVSITAAANFNNICNTVHNLASTSTVSAITANVNSTFAVTNPTSNITFLTNIVKPESSILTLGSPESTPGMGKKGFRIVGTKQVVTSSQSSDKSSPCSASSVGTQKHVNNVIVEASVAGITNLTQSALKTGPSLNKQTVISLLKSGALSHAQSKALTTFMSNASSPPPVVTSVISSPVASRSCSKESSKVASSSKKTTSKDTNATLSRLPVNSMLLPGRKRPNSVLTEEDKRAKRRRLEEKYPLPPGVVIKSEPDDLEDYLVSPGISPAFSANTCLIPTECTESLEPLIMSSDDQVWSVETSVDMGSYLTDSGYPAQEHAAVQGVPVDFAFEDNLSSESCLNAEDISDELDEPPALLDETLDDGDEEVRTEDITDAQEDAPPVLQPMYTSSNCSLVKDSDIEELESTECVPEMSADVTTFMPYDRHIGRAREPSTSADSISALSLYSENSMDSGVDTNCPSTSFSHTSTHGQIADRPLSKNLKIQYLKDLLKKKEMEIENMKKVQSELIPADFDI